MFEQTPLNTTKLGPLPLENIVAAGIDHQIVSSGQPSPVRSRTQRCTCIEA